MKSNMALFIVLLFAIPMASVIIYYYYNQVNAKVVSYEGFTGVTFLSDKDVRTFIQEDRDRYIRNMSIADLRARHVSTPEEYINRIILCDINDITITDNERIFLIECTQMADAFLEKYVYRNQIDGKNIAMIPWKIAILCEAYEEGFPHTRADVIFLSKKSIKNSKEQVASLLIHEKTHIFQRYNMASMDRLLESMGYTVAGFISEPKYRLRRSNPDINNTIYYDTSSKKEVIFKYVSDAPESINDVENKNSIEHPYEQMAYDIANDYLRDHWNNMMAKLGK